VDPVTVAVIAALTAMGTGTALWFRRRARQAEAEAIRLHQALLDERVAACRDNLTGLFNRRGFFEIGATVAGDDNRRPLVVIVADLGQSSDEVMVTLARRLADYATGGVIARLGEHTIGALLTSSINGQGEHYPHAQQLSQLLAEPIGCGRHAHSLIPVGIANVDGPADLADAVRRAGDALRRTVRAGAVLAADTRTAPPAPKPRTHAVVPVYYRSRVVARHYKRP
jgi:GGDEF domain-containing protein